MVNHRREFFNVTLDEIKKVINDNYDKTVEFIDVPDAEQYRISQKMRADFSINTTTIQSTDLSSPTQVPQVSVTGNQPAQNSPALNPSKEYLYTRWGTYEMPEPYIVNLQRGPRNDLKKL